MPAFFPDDGTLWDAIILVNGDANDDYFMLLFTDNATFAYSDVVADRTECTLSGYARLDLSYVSFWTIAVASGVATATGTAVFSFDPYVGLVTIYGYAVVKNDGTTDRLCWEELLDVPFNVPNLGGTLTINLERKYKGCETP